MRAIVGLLLVLVARNLQSSEPSPIPRQTTDKTTRARKNIEEHSAANQTPAAPTQSSVNPATSTKNENPRHDVRTENAQQPVRISEFPAVSVSKDWTDRAYWIFSGFLVLFSGFQAALLYLTLKAVRRQGLSMRRQTTLLRRSARAATKSARAAQISAEYVINGERGWLLMDKQDEPWLIPVEEQPNPQQARFAHCFVTLRNFGKTPAKITGWKAELQIGTSRDRPDDGECFNLDSETFNPALVPPGEPMPLEARFVKGFINAEQVKTILTEKTRFLWLCGRVRYEDVFRPSIEHETVFCYLYETWLNTPQPLWRMSGPAECNKTT